MQKNVRRLFRTKSSLSFLDANEGSNEEKKWMERQQKEEVLCKIWGNSVWRG